MSALYVAAGCLAGAAIARISPSEPLWFLLLIPAGACLAAAVGLDVGPRP